MYVCVWLEGKEGGRGTVCGGKKEERVGEKSIEYRTLAHTHTHNEAATTNFFKEIYPKGQICSSFKWGKGGDQRGVRGRGRRGF